MQNTWRRRAFEAAALSGLAALMALNYQIFILYNSFAPAGINGIATMVQYLFHFSIGYMSLIINLPLAVFAFLKIERGFAAKTLLFVLVFSAATLAFQRIDLSRFIYYTGDGRSTLLAPVASGAINGLIYGCAVHLGGSTGGIDVIAQYVHKHHPEFSLMRIIFVFNTVVALISYFVYDFNVEPVILSIMYSFITSSVSNRILMGGESALKVEIITAHPEAVTEALIKRLRHSVTLMQAEGGYTHSEKTLIVCVINKQQIGQLMDILRAFPDTFGCVSDVSKIFGNFKRKT